MPANHTKNKMKKLLTIIGLAAASLAGVNAQTDYFWNGANTSASPANGGTGTWNATNSWRTVTNTGSQAQWNAGSLTHNAFLQGSAGTVTLGTSGSTKFQGTNMTVSTTGYTVTSTSASRDLVFSGTLNLAASVALTFDMNNTDAIWSFGSISFGTGSSLRLAGIATANNANRFNLTSNGTISGGSISLNGTAAGPTGFASTVSVASGGATLNTNITNDSLTSATVLGATSGNQLNFGGVLGGSAHLQVSAGQSGGAGIVVFNNVSNYTGDTYLNSASNAVHRIGVDNALPSGTTVFFSQSAGGGTIDTGGGSFDLNGQDLAIGGLQGGNSTRGVGNNTPTLSTLTIGKASGSNTFNGTIGLVGNSNMLTQTDNIAVVKSGASSQTFTANNTYSGGTTISAGTLLLTGAGTIGSGNLTLGGGTFDIAGITPASYALSGSQSVTGSGTIVGAAGKTLAIAGTLAPGNSPGTITLDTVAVTLSGTTTFEFTNPSFGVGTFDLVQGTAGGGVESIAFGGILNLNFSGGSYDDDDFVKIFDVGSYSGTFSAVNFSGLDVGQSATFNAANGIVTVVPEPGTWALIGMGSAFLLWRKRRRMA